MASTAVQDTDMIKPAYINDGGLVDHLQPALDNLTERKHDEEKVGSHQAADIKVDAGLLDSQAGTESDQKQAVSESDPKPEALEVKEEEQLVVAQGTFRLCRLLTNAFLVAVPLSTCTLQMHQSHIHLSVEHCFSSCGEQCIVERSSEFKKHTRN